MSDLDVDSSSFPPPPPPLPHANSPKLHGSKVTGSSRQGRINVHDRRPSIGSNRSESSLPLNEPSNNSSPVHLVRSNQWNSEPSTPPITDSFEPLYVKRRKWKPWLICILTVVAVVIAVLFGLYLAGQRQILLKHIFEHHHHLITENSTLTNSSVVSSLNSDEKVDLDTTESPKSTATSIQEEVPETNIDVTSPASIGNDFVGSESILPDREDSTNLDSAEKYIPEPLDSPQQVELSNQDEAPRNNLDATGPTPTENETIRPENILSSREDSTLQPQNLSGDLLTAMTEETHLPNNQLKQAILNFVHPPEEIITSPAPIRNGLVRAELISSSREHFTNSDSNDDHHLETTVTPQKGEYLNGFSENNFDISGPTSIENEIIRPQHIQPSRSVPKLSSQNLAGDLHNAMMEGNHQSVNQLKRASPDHKLTPEEIELLARGEPLPHLDGSSEEEGASSEYEEDIHPHSESIVQHPSWDEIPQPLHESPNPPQLITGYPEQDEAYTRDGPLHGSAQPQEEPLGMLPYEIPGDAADETQFAPPHFVEVSPISFDTQGSLMNQFNYEHTLTHSDKLPILPKGYMVHASDSWQPLIPDIGAPQAQPEETLYPEYPFLGEKHNFAGQGRSPEIIQPPFDVAENSPGEVYLEHAETPPRGTVENPTNVQSPGIIQEYPAESLFYQPNEEIEEQKMDFHGYNTEEIPEQLIEMQQYPTDHVSEMSVEPVNAFENIRRQPDEIQEHSAEYTAGQPLNVQEYPSRYGPEQSVGSQYPDGYILGQTVDQEIPISYFREQDVTPQENPAEYFTEQPHDVKEYPAGYFSEEPVEKQKNYAGFIPGVPVQRENSLEEMPVQTETQSNPEQPLDEQEYPAAENAMEQPVEVQDSNAENFEQPVEVQDFNAGNFELPVEVQDFNVRNFQQPIEVQDFNAGDFEPPVEVEEYPKEGINERPAEVQTAPFSHQVPATYEVDPSLLNEVTDESMVDNSLPQELAPHIIDSHFPEGALPVSESQELTTNQLPFTDIPSPKADKIVPVETLSENLDGQFDGLLDEDDELITAEKKRSVASRGSLPVGSADPTTREVPLRLLSKLTIREGPPILLPHDGLGNQFSPSLSASQIPSSLLNQETLAHLLKAVIPMTITHSQNPTSEPRSVVIPEGTIATPAVILENLPGGAQQSSKQSGVPSLVNSFLQNNPRSTYNSVSQNSYSRLGNSLIQAAPNQNLGYSLVSMQSPNKAEIPASQSCLQYNPSYPHEGAQQPSRQVGVSSPVNSIPPQNDPRSSQNSDFQNSYSRLAQSPVQVQPNQNLGYPRFTMQLPNKVDIPAIQSYLQSNPFHLPHPDNKVTSQSQQDQHNSDETQKKNEPSHQNALPRKSPPCMPHQINSLYQTSHSVGSSEHPTNHPHHVQQGAPQQNLNSISPRFTVKNGLQMPPPLSQQVLNQPHHMLQMISPNNLVYGPNHRCTFQNPHQLFSPVNHPQNLSCIPATNSVLHQNHIQHQQLESIPVKFTPENILNPFKPNDQNAEKHTWVTAPRQPPPTPPEKSTNKLLIPEAFVKPTLEKPSTLLPKNSTQKLANPVLSGVKVTNPILDKPTPLHTPPQNPSQKLTNSLLPETVNAKTSPPAGTVQRNNFTQPYKMPIKYIAQHPSTQYAPNHSNLPAPDVAKPNPEKNITPTEVVDNLIKQRFAQQNTNKKQKPQTQFGLQKPKFSHPSPASNAVSPSSPNLLDMQLPLLGHAQKIAKSLRSNGIVPFQPVQAVPYTKHPPEGPCQSELSNNPPVPYAPLPNEKSPSEVASPPPLNPAQKLAKTILSDGIVGTPDSEGSFSPAELLDHPVPQNYPSQPPRLHVTAQPLPGRYQSSPPSLVSNALPFSEKNHLELASPPPLNPAQKLAKNLLTEGAVENPDSKDTFSPADLLNHAVPQNNPSQPPTLRMTAQPPLGPYRSTFPIPSFVTNNLLQNGKNPFRPAPLPSSQKTAKTPLSEDIVKKIGAEGRFSTAELLNHPVSQNYLSHPSRLLMTVQPPSGQYQTTPLDPSHGTNAILQSENNPLKLAPPPQLNPAQKLAKNILSEGIVENPGPEESFSPAELLDETVPQLPKIVVSTQPSLSPFQSTFPIPSFITDALTKREQNPFGLAQLPPAQRVLRSLLPGEVAGKSGSEGTIAPAQILERILPQNYLSQPLNIPSPASFETKPLAVKEADSPVPPSVPSQFIPLFFANHSSKPVLPTNNFHPVQRGTQNEKLVKRVAEPVKSFLQHLTFPKYHSSKDTSVNPDQPVKATAAASEQTAKSPVTSEASKEVKTVTTPLNYARKPVSSVEYARYPYPWYDKSNQNVPAVPSAPDNLNRHSTSPVTKTSQFPFQTPPTQVSNFLNFLQNSPYNLVRPPLPALYHNQWPGAHVS